MITIEFDHRLDEHLKARRLYYTKKSWFARADKVVAIFLTVFGLILVCLIGPRWWSLIWLVLAPIEWFNLLSIEPLMVRYMFKRSAKFQERTALSFSEDRIHYKTPSIDSTIDWSLFTGVLEDDELFLLPYKAPRTYAIIPKRAFASEEAKGEFRELVRRKVTQASA
jgi:hypothetical protein